MTAQSFVRSFVRSFIRSLTRNKTAQTDDRRRCCSALLVVVVEVFVCSFVPRRCCLLVVVVVVVAVGSVGPWFVRLLACVAESTFEKPAFAVPHPSIRWFIHFCSVVIDNEPTTLFMRATNDGSLQADVVVQALPIGQLPAKFCRITLRLTRV